MKKIKFSKILLILGHPHSLNSQHTCFERKRYKKIVALSTLRQLGFIVSMLGLRCWFLAFSHLINHAFFKALLFVSTGNIIHSNADSQDLKTTGNKTTTIFNTLVIVFITTLRITGITFLRAFYAKEIIIENVLLIKSSSLVAILFLINLYLTPIYALRRLSIFYFLYIKRFTKKYIDNQDNFVQNRIILLLIPAYLSGFLINKSFYRKEETLINANVV